MTQLPPQQPAQRHHSVQPGQPGWFAKFVRAPRFKLPLHASASSRVYLLLTFLWANLSPLRYLSNNSLCGTVPVGLTQLLPVGLTQPTDGALPACQSLLTCGVNNNATVCSALGDLYSATNGASWANSNGWSIAAAGTAIDYCTFFGVTCSNGVLQLMCVRSIWCCSSVALRCLTCALSNLNGNQLSGTMPSTLGSLTGLQTLCVPHARSTIARAEAFVFVTYQYS